MARAQPGDDLSCQELHSVLAETIGTLPEKYRAPIVLCYFEGKSHNQAAKELASISTLPSSFNKNHRRGQE